VGRQKAADVGIEHRRFRGENGNSRAFEKHGAGSVSKIIRWKILMLGLHRYAKGMIMIRSEINRLQKQALEFFRENNFNLPEWGTWKLDDWNREKISAGEIKKRMLGWDVTDFGKGDFHKFGLLIFTLRNGPSDGSGEPYCEKIIVLRDGQTLPCHFHWSKIEDIINRAGGQLVIKLWNSDDSENPADTPVRVLVDGAIWKEVEAGGELVIEPGGSVTLTPLVYHEFRGSGGNVLIGEVSSINDDKKDNRFLETVPRFSSIEEDEPVFFYLCNEYP
jgi:D-lyxose ketol-isomerase